MGRILRKEVEDVTVRWKNLVQLPLTGSNSWKLAMERLMELQDAQDQLDFKLRQAETVKKFFGTCWGPAHR